MNYEDALKEIVLDDEQYIVMTADTRSEIKNLPLLLGERFIDTGISEQTLIAAASGFALRGRIPIIHAMSAFLTMRGFEFIRTDIGVGNLQVKMTGTHAGFLSEANGPAHQALEDVSLMRGIPNVGIFAPADVQDLVICLSKIIEDPSAYYIRYNNTEPVYQHSKKFSPGKAEVVSSGKDVTILTYGFLFSQAYFAKEILEDKGLSVGLVNLRTLKPIDEKLLHSLPAETGYIVTLEDHFITGGLFSILSEYYMRNNLTAKVIPVALENNWFKPLLINEILKHEKFSPEDIADRILRNMKS
ncbi:MAG: transketolase [Ignavibacteria bacterium]|nr:transketolase [Ignavibacteria bacterium]